MHRFIGGTAAVFTTRSPDKETQNEDAAAVIFNERGRAIGCLEQPLRVLPARASRHVLVLERGHTFHRLGKLTCQMATITGKPEKKAQR